MVARVLGALRLHLGRELGLIDEARDVFHWVIDFPLFEWDEESGRWDAVHHPFTRADRRATRSFDDRPRRGAEPAYDLVWNGLGARLGGSFRIHEPELQARSSDVLGISTRRQRAKFGFLLDALAMGAPPHGGFAFGHRPLRDAARRRAEHPRRDRVPEGPGRRRPDDRRADRCRGAARELGIAWSTRRA